MSRPEIISGKDPVYPKEAVAARIQGLVILRCKIDTDGTVSNCHVIKSLPYLEKTVLEAILSRRYTPVIYKGQPIAVDYVFSIKLVLPDV